MAENRFNFTESRLEKVHRAPKGKRDVYYDTEQSNLCLIVTDKGTKGFYVRVTHMGRPVRSHLGNLGKISLKQARDRARDFLSNLTDTNNPHEAKRSLHQEPTLADLFKTYLPHAQKTKKSWKTEEYIFNANMPSSLLNRKPSLIRQEDLIRLKGQVGDTKGPMAANRLLWTLQAIYHFGKEHGHITCPSPVQGIQRFKQNERSRFLEGDELKRFMLALEAEPNSLYKDFFYTCLLTGARRGNVLAMRWNHVDLENAVWRIPTTKNGAPLNVPLVPDLVLLLQERKRTATSVFVFPSTGKTGHLADPQAAWARLLERAEFISFDKDGNKKWLVEPITIHDLRRTMGSWQAILGSSLLVIGKSLGHKSSRATEIYSRLTLDPVRESVTQAASKILEFKKTK